MRKVVYISSLMILFCTSILWAQTWQSSRVRMDDLGKLTYTVDAEGNRIPDFSYAGYRNGEVDIPDIGIVQIISPVAGDNTAHIQNALDAIGSREPDVNGFRGALYLNAGEYEISGTLYIRHSGIVLRGNGDNFDPSSNTILKATGNSPYRRTVLVAGGGNSTSWREEVENTRRDIVSDFVPVGSRSFEVEDASPFRVGDNIIIYHPCTSQWLQAIDYGGTHGDAPWAVDEEPLIFNRYIKSISGNEITIDAPIFNHLNRSLSQAYIYKYRRDGILTNIGIEDLRIDIAAIDGSDENHAWNAIDLYQIEDAWVYNCTTLHFGLSGYRTDTATRITIENCHAIYPHSLVEGGKRYNFQLHKASQLILFKDCHANHGRHHYVSNGASSVSGCVFYNCTSSSAYTSSEGHRRWSMGLLFDNHLELTGPRNWLDPRLLGLYNRGNWGTGHGWASAHSVLWNCDVDDGTIALQKPPTAQNYAIGCFGDAVTGHWTFFQFTVPFNEPQGFIEGTNSPGLEPGSLYLAQLADRLSELHSPTAPNVDSFRDGDFTVNPVWTGDTDKWLVVLGSDVSSGAGYSYTLRLNETDVVSGTKYLSTQQTAAWGTSQSWGAWMGRRLSTASDANQSIIWLWASESDLRSSTVNGYRLRFGGSTGDDGIVTERLAAGDDEIVLERVDNGVVNDIFSSHLTVPEDITDIGFLVRVTRTEISEWRIYTSVVPVQSGQGAIATDIPSIFNTQVYHGSYRDPTYTNFDDGYFGFMAIHGSDNDSRTAAEFDQLFFDTSSDASLPVELISFNATGKNDKVEIKWSTASEFENIGFMVFRAEEEYGQYSELDSYKNNPHLMGAGNSSEKHSYQYIDNNVRNNITYWYKLLDIDYYGVSSEHGPVSAMPSDKIIQPKRYYLYQNYPNPFNSETIIKYELPKKTDVKLIIYNRLGQQIATLISAWQPVGSYEVGWDASDFASGVYFYRLKTAAGFDQTKKLILLK